MKNIEKKLAEAAKEKGICQEGYDELLKTHEPAGLIDMYIKGIDFCLSNDFPSNDFIRDHFKGKMEAHGIHLDEVFSIENQRRVIALGNCAGSIKLDGFSICEVFLKHQSDVEVSATGNSFVMIDMFDKTNLTVSADSQSRVCINRYGGEITFKTDPGAQNIKLREKQSSTY